MRLKLLTLALALSAVCLPGHGEDLLDAYREARANDPVLSQADATRLASNESVPQARALLLPTISGSVNLSQQSGSSSRGSSGNDSGIGNTGNNDLPRGIGHIRSRDESISISQSVFDLSAIANLRAAHSAANAQDATYQAALQDLFVRVTQAYFAVLTAEDQLTFQKANEDALKQQYDQSNQRFKVGLTAVTDVYQAKSVYELAKADTITAQNTLNDAREGLTQLTGKPVGELKKLRDDLPLTPPTPNDQGAWVSQAMKDNPTILAAQYNVESADHSVNAARAGHLPTIGATLSRGTSSSWAENIRGINGPYNGRYGTTIGLTLNVPIFEGGATQSKVRQNIYQRDSQQDQLEINRRQVTRDTLNYYRSVLAGIHQVEANEASVDSGKKALEATHAGYDVGTQTLLDVLTAIQTLTQAQSSYSQSRHTFVLSQLQLKQSAGNIDIKDMERINALLQ